MKITQAELFERFPGIYFNPLCRTVNKDCSEPVKNRRRNSFVVKEDDVEKLALYVKKLAQSCVAHDNQPDCEELHAIRERIQHFTYKQKSTIYSSLDSVRRYINDTDMKQNKALRELLDMFRPKWEAGRNTRRAKQSRRRTPKKVIRQMITARRKTN